MIYDPEVNCETREWSIQSSYVLYSSTTHWVSLAPLRFKSSNHNGSFYCRRLYAFLSYSTRWRQLSIIAIYQPFSLQP